MHKHADPLEHPTQYNTHMHISVCIRAHLHIYTCAYTYKHMHTKEENRKFLLLCGPASLGVFLQPP